MNDQAHARRSDPDTSYQAADVVTPDLRDLQRRVEAYAKRAGSAGFMDAQMEHDCDDAGSTLRTRRSELTARNIVLDSGRRAQWADSPRRRIVWIHRDFVAVPPPICEPPHVMTKEDRAKGLDYAGKLERAADGMHREGRAMFADMLRETAIFIRAII